MNSPRVTYTPRPDATPEAEICALVSVYAFILQKNQERQEWLVAAEHRVVVPYAGELAAAIPPVVVRLRRYFGTVLNLIRAHAILNQASRERDAGGRIIATLEDYARVRELVADLVSEGIETTVPATVRETVEMVNRLHDETNEEVTIAALVAEIKLDKSAAWRRVRSAMDRGYVKNLEDRKGRPARLVAADALPDDIEILPTPERLQGCTVAIDSEGIKTNNLSGPADSAQEKDFLLTPLIRLQPCNHERSSCCECPKLLPRPQGPRRNPRSRR